MRLSVKPAVSPTALVYNGVTTVVQITNAYGVPGDSESILVQSHKWACYAIFIDAIAGPASRLDALVQESPDGTNWAPLQTEAVAAGVATLSDYEQQKAFAGTGLLFIVHAPVRGGQYQRIRLKVDAGTADVRVQYSLSGGPV
jgi:hypothetical protein